MYGNSSPFASHGQRASNMYNRVGVETDVMTASPHRLVTLLLDGAFDSMTQAIGAIRTGNVEVKNRSLSRAVRILDEGLKAALDLESGELALDLRDLYAYICMRLTYANLHSDAVAVEECVTLLQPIREAWGSIAPAAAADQRAAA
ncbi:flagellar export chaperone FliS [Mitsuaria sp. GD03876]|uniref:flagellar export chaperone FliS n=1 Tax=Mitsuaria sp. GD03876 TaxID=2975399 RepID=UPI00244D5F0F|nr:flagellar export chaperone FliS [Mitsuaria sp. GD03876]MDH0865127.1 flagellar export chaperone FliS [Mitsuaria sp. GD03876]